MSMPNTTTPIIHVKKSLTIFTFDAAKPIRLGLNPDDAQIAITQINDNIEQYTSAIQPAITASTKTENGSSTTDDTVLKAANNAKREIVLSAMSNDFHTKYRLDIKVYKNAADLLQFIKQTFGEYTQRQRENAAKRELTNATRRTADNEPFELFLKRLKAITTNVSSNIDVQNDRVDEAFRSNLTPVINTFLLEHDKLDSSCAEIAKFLDLKQKHKKSADINLIERMDKIDQLEKLIVEMKLNQASQMASLTQMVQESLGTQQKTEINAIRKSNTPSRKPWTNSNKNERCKKCGMFNHKTSECSGKCRLTCRRCNQIGHLEAVCNVAKNE